jgi:D-alanyl-D-alanine-carboxypeptidase/D-alanyl-D-alanine-endopeptidase
MARGSVGLFFVMLAFGCATRAVGANPLAGAATEPGRFIPGHTTPERRAKLVAVRPKLDELYEKHAREARPTGMAVGIVMDGELVYVKTLGVQDVASNTPVSPDTVYRIASMTKNVAAMAIVQLRDEGRLSLDAPISDFVPELRHLVGVTRDAPPITVRMLLTHASGLAYDDYWGKAVYDTSPEELTRLLESGVVLSHAPGARYQYSNLGYAILGRIVERVTGMRFQDYATQRILHPLGMTASGWGPGEVPAGRLALGYWRDGDHLRPEGNASDGAFMAAGGLYTSVRDYARYVAFNLAAYPPRDDVETGPLRRASLREMHEGQRWMRSEDRYAPIVRDGSLSVASYGFGWWNHTTCEDEGIVQHGGSEPGYFSWVMLFRQSRVGIFAFGATAPGFAWQAPAILREAGLLTPAPDAPPHPALVEAVPSIEALRDEWSADRVARLFDPPSLRWGWFMHIREDFAALHAKHGRCWRVGALETRGPLRGIWKLACERGSIELDVTMTPAIPIQVQYVTWTEEFPADAPTLELARQSLTQVDAKHGTCTVVDGARRIERQPMGPPWEQHIFRLQCAHGDLDMALRLDAGRVAEVSAYPRRGPDDLCWQ